MGYGLLGVSFMMVGSVEEIWAWRGIHDDMCYKILSLISLATLWVILTDLKLMILNPELFDQGHTLNSF